MPERSARPSRARATARANVRPVSLLLTCEHGGNLVPGELAPILAGRRRLLESHRGWDPGALELAGRLAATLQAPLCFALVSRLVVDLNRSIVNPALWSDFTRALTSREQRGLLERHYHPYRRQVRAMVARRVRPLGARCMHVSVHTFTPILRGRRRGVDIGVLFDPARPFERRAAALLVRHLERELPKLRIRRNQPYKGADDGLTTALRRDFPDDAYAGLELEVNQRFPRRAGAGSWARVQSAIARALDATLANLGENSPR